MNKRTRKLMTMHKVLHPRNDIDCQDKKKEDEDCVDTAIQGLEEKSKERLITAANNSISKRSRDRKITKMGKQK